MRRRLRRGAMAELFKSSLGKMRIAVDLITNRRLWAHCTTSRRMNERRKLARAELSFRAAARHDQDKRETKQKVNAQ